VILQQDDGQYLLDVVPARQLRDLEEEGLVRLALRELGLQTRTITMEYLRAQPRRGNCAFVWSYKERAVPVGIRMRVLQALRDEDWGACSKDCRPTTIRPPPSWLWPATTWSRSTSSRSGWGLAAW
jgi:hypothetical protein